MSEISFIQTRLGEKLQIEGALPEGFRGVQQGEL
jgi:hypothetical protein